VTDHQATGSSKGGQRYLLAFKRHIAKNIVKGKVIIIIIIIIIILSVG